MLTRSRNFVEEEIERGDTAVAGDYEVCAGIGWALPWQTRNPLNASSGSVEILRFLQRRIEKVGMSGADGAGNLIDFVPTLPHTFRFVEAGVFGEYLFDGRAPPPRLLPLKTP